MACLADGTDYFEKYNSKMAPAVRGMSVYRASHSSHSGNCHALFEFCQNNHLDSRTTTDSQPLQAERSTLILLLKCSYRQCQRLNDAQDVQFLWLTEPA